MTDIFEHGVDEKADPIILICDLRELTGWSPRTTTRRLAGVPRIRMPRGTGYGYAVALSDIRHLFDTPPVNDS